MSDTPKNIGSRYLRQRILLLSFLLLGLLFLATVTLTRTYEARKETLVREWAQEGDSSLAAGNAATALEDYRNALAYDPENGSVQLRLAQSLLTDGRLQEARTYLLNLWEQSPGSGILNLELARIASRLGVTDQATFYYRTAILGAWDQHAEEQRRSARLELCQYLIDNGRNTDAQAEIMGLAADTPPGDAAGHVQVGDDFMKVGAPARALAEFEQGLKIKPNDATFNELAGQAAYAAADYASAEKYFARSLRQSPSDQGRQMLLTVREIQQSDPFLAGLSEREKSQRTLDDYEQASRRFEDCSKSATGGQGSDATGVAALSKESAEFKPKMNLRGLQKDPEMQHQAMHVVFQMEDFVARTCRTPRGLDEALVLIGKKHLQSEQ